MTTLGGTMAPAPIIEAGPTSTPSSTIAPIPTRALSPIVAPWTMAPWETIAPFPFFTGLPTGVSTMQFSQTVAQVPISTESLSPRTTAPFQIPDPSLMMTSTMTKERGATKTDPSTLGFLSP